KPQVQPASVARQPAGSIRLEDLEAVKGLLGRVGADNLKALADLLARGPEPIPFGTGLVRAGCNHRRWVRGAVPGAPARCRASRPTAKAAGGCTEKDSAKSRPARRTARPATSPPPEPRRGHPPARRPAARPTAPCRSAGSAPDVPKG